MIKFKFNLVVLMLLALVSLSGCSGMKPTAKNGKPGLSVPFDWPQKTNPETAEELDNLGNNTTKLDIH